MGAWIRRTAAPGGRAAFFGFRMAELRLAPSEDAVRQALSDQVALLAALEGHRDATFALQLSGTPDLTHPDRGRVAVDLLCRLDPPPEGEAERTEELVDDVADLLASHRRWYRFQHLDDEPSSSSAFEPHPPLFFAEVARREEPLDIMRKSGSVGFGRGVQVSDLPLLNIWSFSPSIDPGERLAHALLAQEAPVTVRVLMKPTALLPEEEGAIEQLVFGLRTQFAEGSIPLSGVRTLEALLYQRPLYEVQVIVASSAPLSPSLLSSVGYAISPPAAEVSPARGLEGSYAIERFADDKAKRVALGAFGSLELSPPRSSVAPASLARLRRLMGPWEAVAAFRIPIARQGQFPGLTVTRTPPLSSHSMPLVDDGVRIGSPDLTAVGSEVRLAREDRFRHVYLVGQTGTGKSTTLLNMILQDIENGAGVAVVDPHGDLVEAVLARIPDGREEDVVLVDPADPISVVGLNLLEAETPVQAEYLVSDLCAWFYQIYDPGRTGIVGPRFETWLRYAAQTLLASKGLPATLLEIPTLFVDNTAVRRYLADVDDPLVFEFWTKEMAQTSDYHKSEILGWFRSKFEPFRSSKLVRDIIGQSRSTVSLRELMDNRGILLANLSKGQLGEYNSALLGFVIFAKLWAATLMRAAKKPEARNDFFLYVDEFQTVTTESLPSILSESRKFRLGLTMANQFFSQTSERVRAALMGNVGSRLAFRLGYADASLFAAWFGREVTPDHLSQLPNFCALSTVLANGEPMTPFLLHTDFVPDAGEEGAERAERIRELSRKKWGRPRDLVEEEILGRWRSAEDE